MDRQLPVADAYRLRTPVVLTDAEDTMRRYPQMAAGLPFRFGSMYVPVMSGTTAYGVLAVLRPPLPRPPSRCPTGPGSRRSRSAWGRPARPGGGRGPVALGRGPDGRTAALRGLPEGFIGHFVWDPSDSSVTADATFWDMTGGAKDDAARSPEALASAISPDDAHLVLGARGRPPPAHRRRVRSVCAPRTAVI